MWSLDKKKCLSCGACVSVCPKAALELEKDGPSRDERLCNLCGICERACPVKAIKVQK
jgi:ferredoxin